ncbi:MAG: hypothetical protein H8E42_00060 [Nitrospinae bacterium]|nr:hypothetical protein [Nitrospinota bacterium]
MSGRDADFSEATKRIIAGRAGYRCSFINCDESTIGPGEGPDDVERKGVAAHIFSAAENGPRGTGALTIEQRQEPPNGIWVCEDHGKIIDIDKGKNYPANILQAWKGLQENRIAQEVRKVPSKEFGWIEKIILEKTPLFQFGASVSLGKVTLLVGANGVGKSALCEWLSGCAGEITDFERWRETKERQCDLRLRVVVFNPDRQELAVHFYGYEMRCSYAGKPVMDLSHALRVLYINEELCRENEDEDDVEYLARIWRVHLRQVPRVLNDLCSSKYGYIKSTELRPSTEYIEDENGEETEQVKKIKNGRQPMGLYVEIGSHDFLIPLDGLSGGERSQLLVSGAMVIADHYSTHQRTLLILELGNHSLDDGLLSEYSKKMQGPDFRFQTILVSPSERPKVDWTGWSVARLSGKPPAVHFEQNKVGELRIEDAEKMVGEIT